MAIDLTKVLLRLRKEWATANLFDNDRVHWDGRDFEIPGSGNPWLREVFDVQDETNVANDLNESTGLYDLSVFSESNRGSKPLYERGQLVAERFPYPNHLLLVDPETAFEHRLNIDKVYRQRITGPTPAWIGMRIGIVWRIYAPTS